MVSFLLRRLTACLLLGLSPVLFLAQSYEWYDLPSATSFSDGQDVVLTQDQSALYAVGDFAGTITIGSTVYNSQGGDDGFLIKYDTLGQVLWSRRVGGPDFVNLTSVGTDSLDNVYVFGFGQGTIQVDNISLVNSGFGGFLAKYDPQGNVLWARRIDTRPNINFSFSNQGDRLTVLPDGRCFIFGRFPTFSDSLVIEPNVVNSLGPNEETAGFIASFDAQGVGQWIAKLIQPPGTNGTRPSFYDLEAITVDERGAIYTVGIFVERIRFIPYLEFLRYDLAGNLVQRLDTIPFPVNVASGYDAAFMAKGKTVDDFYFVPQLGPNFVFGNDTTGGPFSPTQLTIIENQQGQWEILKKFESTVILGDFQTTDDGFYLAGSFSDQIRFPNDTLFGSVNSPYAIKLDTSFQLEFGRVISGSAFGSYNSLDVSQTDKLYIAGTVGAGISSFQQEIFIDGDTIFAQSRDPFFAKISCLPISIKSIIGDTISCLQQQVYRTTNLTNPEATYNWWVDGGGTLTVNRDSVIVDWNTTGLYTLSVSTFNSCGNSLDTARITVRVVDEPEIPQFLGDSLSCIGSEAYGVVNTFGENYAWSLSSGGLIFPQGNTAVVNWALTGMHDIEVIASNICGVSPPLTQTIEVSQVPFQPAPIQGNANVCTGTETYQVPALPDVSYTWSLSSGGIISANGNTATVIWNSAGSHTLTVTPSNECGVGSIRSLVVQVTEVPAQPSAVIGDLRPCVGTSFYSIVGQTNVSYTWSLASGGFLVANGASATINWTTPGTHSLTITPANVCGSGTARTILINVQDVPSRPASIQGLDTVCLGPQRYIVPPTPGISYTWALSGGGSLIPNGNSVDVNWTSPGTYTLTVTPANVCGQGLSRSLLIQVNAVNPSITGITGSDSSCLQIQNYSVPNVPGFTYSWNLSSGGALTNLNNTAFVNWLQPGLHTLSVRTSDGCTNALSVNVADIPAQPGSIQGDTLVCLGTSNYFIPPALNTDYTWTLNGGGTLSFGGNLATVIWQTPGTYTLSVIPQNDCGNGTAQTLTVVVADIPAQPSPITGPNLTCIGTATYQVVNTPGLSYNWSLSRSGGVLQPTGNAVSVDWLVADTNTVIVSAQNLCGTSPAQRLPVTILDIPLAARIAGDTSVCLGTATYTIDRQAFESYSWQLSSGGALSVVNDTAFINWTVPGTHQLTVQPSNPCGTGLATTITINVKDVPTLPGNIIGNTDVCLGIAAYQVTNLANTQYAWQISGGGSLSSLGNSANVGWITPGQYTLSVQASNVCGAGNTLSTNILVEQVPAQPAPIQGDFSPCLDQLTYRVPGVAGVTYAWSLSGGGTLNFAGDSAVIDWASPGIYTLSVVPTNDCGTGTARSQTIVVSDLPPTPQFSLADTAVCLGAELYTVAPSTNTTFSWDLSGGGNLTANTNSATVNWNAPGTYTIAVTAGNACGTTPATQLPVRVRAIPDPVALIQGPDSSCQLLQTYEVPNLPEITYNWRLSSGGNLVASGNTANIDWLNEGKHTLSLTPSNQCGSATTTDLTVVVLAPPTEVFVLEGPLQSCEELSSNYAIASLNDASIRWELDGGGSLSPSGSTATINWQQAGFYPLTATAFNQCGDGFANTVQVEVLPNNLSIGEIVGDTLACAENTSLFSLPANDEVSYVWYLAAGNGSLTTFDNSLLVGWQAAGVASVAAYPTNVCGIGDTTFWSIQVDPLLGIPNILSRNDSLISSIPIGVQWYQDDQPIEGATAQGFLPTEPGDYTVSASNACGQTLRSLPFTIGENLAFYLYPNPARESVTLYLPSYLEAYRYSIVDSRGKTLLEREIPDRTTRELLIDLGSVAFGQYVVEIKTALGVYQFKLLVAP